MNQRSTLVAAAVLGFLAVGLGAFGAHAFKPALVASGRMDTYELAVRYQFYHVFALLASGILMSYFAGPLLRAASSCFMAGVVIFCGSLYALSFTGVALFGAVTPFGGLAFLAGWICLTAAVMKRAK
jgi:uncharacterized membrane protein YgdD (TMEM256/DUF423 family)